MPKNSTKNQFFKVRMFIEQNNPKSHEYCMKSDKFNIFSE